MAPRERVLSDSEIKTLWWGLDDAALPAVCPQVESGEPDLDLALAPVGVEQRLGDQGHAGRVKIASALDDDVSRRLP